MRSTRIEHHRFRFQIARLNAAAKLTHVKYGSISHPAGTDRRRNAIIVARMANQRKTMSTKAAPGLRRPKNNPDQAALRAS